MKCKKRLLIIFVFLSIICGCSSKHGYEGEYQIQRTTSIGQLNEAFKSINELLGTDGEQRIVIGKNYIERDGIRTDFKKIYVKESGSSKYLIFVSEDGEDSMKIEDGGNKLVESSGLFNIAFVKVESER